MICSEWLSTSHFNISSINGDIWLCQPSPFSCPVSLPEAGVTKGIWQEIQNLLPMQQQTQKSYPYQDWNLGCPTHGHTLQQELMYILKYYLPKIKYTVLQSSNICMHSTMLRTLTLHSVNILAMMEPDNKLHIKLKVWVIFSSSSSGQDCSYSQKATYLHKGAAFTPLSNLWRMVLQ